MGRFGATVFTENTNNNIDITDEFIQKEFADVKDMDFPYEPTMEGAEAINAAIEGEYYDICEECGFKELEYFSINRTEMPVNEAFGDGGWIEKSKNFFISIGKKIKALFDRFMVMLNRFIMTDKAFVKKYGDKIKSASTAGVEIKGFKFDLSNGVDKAASRLSAYVNAGPGATTTLHKDKKQEEIVSQIRAKAIGGGESELSGSEFSKELFKLFRSGEESKVDLTSISTSDIVSEITTAKKDKEDAMKAYTAIKKTINDMIKATESLRGNLKKEEGSTTNGNAQKAATNSIDDMKSVLSVLQTYNGAYLTAIKARNRQNKGIALKLISGSKTENFEMSGEFSFI